MIKYAIALRLGTAETEAILKRVTRNNLKHPTFLALAELGKAIKNNFLCRYLHSEALRREIQEGLNVIDTWNGANSFILYGKGGEIAANELENQELTMLALHPLQKRRGFRWRWLITTTPPPRRWRGAGACWAACTSSATGGPRLVALARALLQTAGSLVMASSRTHDESSNLWRA
jgi:hypothetical protein